MKEIKKIKGKFKHPPGIQVLHFKKEKDVEKLYNIIDKMYNKLNINLKNSVIAYINESRGKPEYYDPNVDDLRQYLRVI